MDVPGVHQNSGGLLAECLVRRHPQEEEQLKIWTKGDLSLPTSVWLPGLFNPKAFITAVMQTYARTNKLPLDVMSS